MITTRYKKTTKGKYSVYLDIYYLDEDNNPVQEYQFLRIYVSRDYSKTKRILAEDKQKMQLVHSIHSKKVLELFGEGGNFELTPKRVNLSLLKIIMKDYENTKREHYKYLHDHLKKYSKKKNLLITDISLEFIEGFKSYLLTKISHNTMVHLLWTLQGFIRRALNNDLINFDIFSKYTFPALHETKRTYLEFWEVQKLADNRIGRWLDMEDAFLFSCFTGLRYSDIKRVCYDDIVNKKDKNGISYRSISLYPEKSVNTSGKLLEIPLSEQAEEILKGMQRQEGTTRIFSNLPSKTTINKWLKKWADNAGIDKNLHFHVARHTFATMGLTNDIDIYTMSKLLGHSSLDVTQIYARVVDAKKEKEIQKFPEFNLSI